MHIFGYFLLTSLLLFEWVGCYLISINVGILVPKTEKGIENTLTYNTSVGAVITGINRAKELQLYDPSIINITFSWYFNQCDEALTAGYIARLMYKDKVGAVMGPVCPETSFVAGALANYKKIPVFLWGPTAPGDFYNREKYPTTMPVAGTARGIFIALTNVLNAYDWVEVAFLYSTSQDINAVCGYFSETFEQQTNTSDAINPVLVKRVNDTTPNGFKSLMQVIKSRARIIISCFETQEQRRNYTLAAIDNKMTTPDFVHLFIQIAFTGFGNPPIWVGNDGREAEIKEAAKSILIIDRLVNTSQERLSMLHDMANNIFGWPFYCKDCPKNGTASTLTIFLADAMLSYLWALNKTYTKYNGISQLRNNSDILSNYRGILLDMPSVTGTTYILNNGIRAARFGLFGLNTSGQSFQWATIRTDPNAGNQAYVLTLNDSASSIWAIRGGVQPLSQPVCGYLNEKCPQSPIFYTVIVVCCVVLFCSVIGLLVVAIFFFQRQQRKRLNALWQIPYLYLQRPEEKETTKSLRSMATIHSNNTNSSRSTIANKNTDKTEFLYYNQTTTVARKYSHTDRWSDAEEAEFRMMRTLDHTNLNRFLGIAISGNTCYVLLNYCERGSLMEVIKAHGFRIDSYIMTGMIRNIVEGLYYIHGSSFVQHGSLSVYRCVVSDRFEVKIQLYGLSGLKAKTFRRLDEHSALFVAPEHMHGQQNEIGSQAGDIYSLGIISSVILTLKPAFNCDEDDEKQAAEIVRAVAKGKYPPVRPELEIDPAIEVNHELISLVKKMYSEHPPERPTIETIREIILKRISTSRSTNLMDYMFALMENNAAELEQDVQQRTVELLEEQKKADVLLYRMMPREAADLLKLGQTVTPEVFESATVFFSDIVSFTILASKSTPLQIINFLNETYTLADGVIDRYDTYKVETIGDGMHVVSGVPKRNGTAHVKAICDMAIDFQRAVKTLRLSHLPEQQIQMRVGVHSGPCVAGIVGITSPRYIVFGDTVNVAAKMEASGRAGRIHISANTKSLLQTHYKNAYSLYERGETLIKGVGAMHTHWLVPPEEILNFQP